MKSSLILAAACTSVALAQNVQTEWDWTTVYVTVTNPASATEIDSSIDGYAAIGGHDGRGNRGGQYRQSKTTDAAPEASSSQPAAVVVEVQQFRPNQYGGGQGAQQASKPTSSSAAPVAESTQAPADDTPASSGLGGYKGPILDAHNLHRANHSVPAVAWSDSLASIAAQIAASCVYEHDTKTGGGGYGQNIGAGTLPDEVNAMITNAMYNGEINDYPGYGREPDMGNFHKWGHYSQIVWKSTTEVGCATQYCPGGLKNTGSGISPYFTVCNYKPAGNFGGQYGANVLKPLGKATVVV